MTEQEAQEVFAIVSTADGGCSTCVGALVDALKVKWPEFHWQAWYEEWLDA